jgi:uncharacterized protein YqgV (UPF0045/DUF77 family)
MKQPEASIAIQMLPRVEGEKVIDVVDAVILHIKNSGLNYFVGPFETTVEGDFDTLWELAKRCHKICIEEGAPEVIAYIKVFYNPKKGVWSIDKKVAKHEQ